MGQEIAEHRFSHADFQRFGRRLQAELQDLHDCIERGALSRHAPMAGLELEAWLVDAQGRPAPRNAEFLAALGSDAVVTELGRFNIELNVPPQPVAGEGLARLGEDLRRTWARCTEVAATLGLQVLATGILPSLRDDDLTLANLSERARYRALNQQVLRQRHGRPIRLDISDATGHPGLHAEHHDVMLEAATTSFQVHLQVPAEQALRHYNAALVASGPVLALAVNSPLLFGRALWAETRVPLFEQALSIGAREDGAHGALPRVGFGSGYASYSLLECFRENLDRFEPLLPVALDDSAGRWPHLRLHNGTIWRWNRPLLGFDADGTPHLRIEHRPLPAGPTLPDMLAQLVFVIGLVTDLAADPAAEAEPPEMRLPFEQARANFHAAARWGLDAPLRWLDGHVQPARALLPALLPRARQGLQRLGVAAGVIDPALALLAERLARGATGARWQLQRLAARGGDLSALTRDLAQQQAAPGTLLDWADAARPGAG